jgi:hypothetical protein
VSSNGLVQRLWNYCNVLRDDGLSYGDYLEQFSYLLFLTGGGSTPFGSSRARWFA